MTIKSKRKFNRLNNIKIKTKLIFEIAYAAKIPSSIKYFDNTKMQRKIA